MLSYGDPWEPEDRERDLDLDRDLDPLLDGSRSSSSFCSPSTSSNPFASPTVPEPSSEATRNFNSFESQSETNSATS